jgi:transcriptional antiterminator RfaH
MLYQTRAQELVALAAEAAQWLVGRTQSRRERWAAANAERQGAETYLPLVLERGSYLLRKGHRTQMTPGARYRSSRVTPLFPGYIFIRTLQWRYLLGTFGLIDLVRSGELPSIVPQTIIDDLRKREAEGIVQLPEAQKYLFHDNDAVRVIDGPFAGKQGIVTGYTAVERVRVLLDLLGRKVPTLIGEGQLELV